VSGAVRGADHPQTALFSYMSVEERIPADHAEAFL